MATQTVHVEAKEDESHSSGYTIVRKTTQVERMFYIYHRLGIQSNVVVAARYASAQPGRQGLYLSDEAVFSALNAVITKYPEIGLVGVVEQSDANTHLLSMASLHTIDLDTCVEFIDDEVPELDENLFEKLHGEWFWAEDEVKPGQPWWKVMVLGRRDVVFVFHHSVCDGSFGMTFHREFLAALNESAGSGARMQISRKIQLNPDRVRLSANLEEAIRRKPPMFGILFGLVMFLFYRFFYAKALFFTDYPKPKPLLKDPLAIATSSERTKTKVTNYRIPAEKMDAILAACRAHGTTFTPFMMVMITGTLAADFYPKAKVGFTRYAVDMKAVGNFETLAGDQGKDLNLAASVPEPEWLRKYRRAFPASPSGEKTDVKVDSKAAWKLVRDYGRRMKNTRAGGEDSAVYKAWLSGNAMGPSLEEFAGKSLPSLKVFMQNTFSFSNLGALKSLPQASNVEEPTVKIADVQFSTGSPHGAAGYHGMVFNTAGVAGGDTVINACTEAGMAPEGMSRAVLDGAMARIDAIVQ
ncbi:hypothetical protein CSOJ01_12520 [Colletotrichum sojae]|uniref:Alcohol acetyltransferase n=1 Tax=Colletotrichum sojae TaxID=2175907 RepID=A0A8H6IVD1_9PEZI|nr:hypothetical protein CSOJ01_12520 [Colletotrichum sojae]